MTKRTIGIENQLYEYMLSILPVEPGCLKDLREENARDALKARMQIAPEQARFLSFLMPLIGAHKTIENGVLSGYSAMAVAMALPEDGYVMACESNDDYLEIARRHWTSAGLSKKIKARSGAALDTLQSLLQSGEKGKYDFALIDADKSNYSNYYELCLQLLRPGGIIAVDNVFWSGAVADENILDTDTQSIRALNATMARDSRVDISIVPIGDGMTLARKL